MCLIHDELPMMMIMFVLWWSAKIVIVMYWQIMSRAHEVIMNTCMTLLIQSECVLWKLFITITSNYHYSNLMPFVHVYFPIVILWYDDQQLEKNDVLLDTSTKCELKRLDSFGKAIMIPSSAALKFKGVWK